MRLSFIVSAFHRPELLVRLVEKLGGRPCYIHVDRRTSAEVYARMLDPLQHRAGVAFLPRHACHWGDFGHVEATLKGLKALSTVEYDYVALLTGQCYPLRSVGQMEAELSGCQGKSLMEATPFPLDRWSREDGGYKRIDRFHFPYWLFEKRIWIKLWRRKIPYGLNPYGGSGYWCISRPCAEYILKFVETHPDYVNFSRTTYAPDEFFFQTILANSPFRDQLVSKPIHYIEWPGPKILADEDLDRVFASNRWFARKFADTTVLDKIDDRLHCCRAQLDQVG